MYILEPAEDERVIFLHYVNIRFAVEEQQLHTLVCVSEVMTGMKRRTENGRVQVGAGQV